MDEQLWVVWVLMDDGWFPGEAQFRMDAEREAKIQERDGRQVRIHPRHKNSLQDLIEG